jgi:trimeric autotransporter adhesin
MPQTRCRTLRSPGLALAVAVLSAATGWAATPKEPAGPLDRKEFFRPELYLSNANRPLADVLGQMPNRAEWESFLQSRSGSGAGQVSAVFIDPRSGAATNVVGSFPLIPGDGAGNQLTKADVARRLGRAVESVDEAVVGQAVLHFVKTHSELLGIDVAELGRVRARAANADLWHVTIPQVHQGLPVRHGKLVAAVSHGNLVTIGTESWGAARVDTDPRVTGEDALAAGFAFADGRVAGDELLREPALEIVPFAPPEHQKGEGFAGPLGAGYGHRLVWTFVFQRPPDQARWEVMVDARDGEVIAFEDKNQYVTKQATGGVYPLTNTEICPTPQTCGTMQLGWPMPFANTGLAAPNNFTNSAGNFEYTSGTANSTLAGRFIRISDNCGAISLASPTGDLAFGGANGDHDCVTPGFGGAGNTAASRSAFYELNKIAEQARGFLPANAWLQAQLVSNVNIPNTCNAFWGGGTVNFYRSGGGCRNTGEIAAVFDHEWGHGIDDNDTGGTLSNSSEGYADIAAIYRLQASCVGHGFNLATTPPPVCGLTVDGTGNNRNETQNGTATHCNTDCSGVRDADWAKHVPNTPDTPTGFVCTSCNTGGGPCGRQVHCAAAPSRQAAWDLVTRDLTAAPFNYDSQTAFIVGNKVFYQGSGLIGAWHACTCGGTSDGCGATNGYMQWLAADDDNGNLADGTPHMTALFAAFNRHQIACATPAPQNGGCAAGPSAAPTSFTAVGGNSQVVLNWAAASGATRYWIFRTEGHAGCNFGKVLIAEVTGLTYTDTQVANGRSYSYNVVAAGTSSACYSVASTCATTTPTATADFGLSCNPQAVSAPPGGSVPTVCTVQSLAGFASAVNLSCNNPPAGVTCSYSPGSVTPPANGTTASTLTISVGAVAAGNYTVRAQGVSGALTRTFDIALTVLAQSVAPISLAVDAGGNGVLQPNESAVTVAPTWRNTGAGSVALTGALTNFTGPTGPTYTINDAAADYGTIPAASNQACTNCYAVTVASSSRPAMHWDAQATETVSPTGSTKDWTLHVGDSFTDVPASNGFYRFVEILLHKSVTGGCAADTYCPSNATTREQMAAFVLVSKEGAGYNPPACSAPNLFVDVPETSPFCKFIEELANRQVVAGCQTGFYCPQSPVQRNQMAIFVLRTLDPTLNPPACGTPVFADVPASDPFCRWIEELARRNVVTGCGGGNYCPTASVTRDQMGVFLSLTFGLTLYGL